MKKNVKQDWHKMLYAAPVYLTDKLGTAGGGLTQLFGSQNLAGFLQNAFNTAIIIGGILAVVRLMYGGWLYMTTDIPGMKGNAKGVITNALMGLVILLGVVLILNQINPDILKLDVYLENQGGNTTTTTNSGTTGPVSGYLGAPAVSTYSQVSKIPIGRAYYFSPSQGKFVATADVATCSTEAQKENQAGCKMLNTVADRELLLRETKKALYGVRYRNTVILPGGQEQDWCVNSAGTQVICSTN